MSFQYKTGQVPFEKADRTKSFQELLGEVSSSIVLPVMRKYETPLKTRAFLGLRRIIQKYWVMDEKNFSISGLSHITIDHLLSYLQFGSKA
jgi:hypothetical protein